MNIQLRFSPNNILFVLAVCLSTNALSQQQVYTKYYDSLWAPVASADSVQDSITYDETGKMVDYIRYYPTGNILVHGGYDIKTGKDFSEAYDENGKVIPGYIFLREASFPGGNEGWMNYLSTNLDTKIFSKKKAPKGAYRVIVTFIVDKSGHVVDVNTDVDPGYGIKEEVVRAISSSPRWKPCIMENIPVNAYRRQPLTIKIP